MPHPRAPIDISLLIVGGDSDPNTQRVADQAHLRGIDYVFWDTDQDNARQIAWDFDRCEIDLGDRLLRPTAVYLRYNVFGGEAERNQAAFDTVESFAMAWPNVRLLNRQTSGDANNKSRNLVRAKECGFTIPLTTVLADLSPLSSLPDHGAKIIKPLGGGDHAYLVSDVKDDADRLATLKPQFIQEKLDGENLRVFSIGGHLHAFHLKTDELDYRTDHHVKVLSVPVPESITASTRQLVERIGFDYCALDFRCRNGFEDPVFLEINSFPMFVAFDDACENRLADAILSCLLVS